MALKFSQPSFTIFAPNSLSPSSGRPATEIRFSRWNNANAEKFIRHERAQNEIEGEIRRERRYESASRISDNYQNTTMDNNTKNNDTFKSIGTPSSPSRPSIPGKSSKYSKKPNPRGNSDKNPTNRDGDFTHPAFRRFSRVSTDVSKVPIEANKGITIGENGVSYKIPNAPFEFQYSYTETPKVKPLALREPPFVPFGPSTMPRPWTGRAPLPPSKKKLPEFDSFRLPPPHKKGVKPVQAPGPFLAGSGPKYVKSREEILGEPLTNEEIKELIQSCLKTRRQLNMGRDGLTHNMLDNINALWKRRRVCKIKCKGVCTVDMDNVCQQLEEKTGGKIIYSRGGVLFLFRGRNYNYRSRPRFPLMLWKPVTPVYPRLILHAPEGLTLEEATEMRKKGRKLPPICKLGKNGVYSELVSHVREAFEECELARIDCQGMNGSDYKKIGAKLKDLVPCVLISFEREHILMWRGSEWKSCFTKSDGEMDKEVERTEKHGEIVNPSNSDDSLLVEVPDEAASLEGSKALLDFPVNDQLSKALDPSVSVVDGNKPATLYDGMCVNDADSTHMLAESTDDVSETILAPPTHLTGSIPSPDAAFVDENLQVVSEGSSSPSECSKSISTCTEGIVKLLEQAKETGSAVILDDASLDSDIVFDRAVALAKISSPGPVFRQRRLRKVLVQKREKQENGEVKIEAIVTVSKKRIEKKVYRNPKLKDFKEVYPDSLPSGSLGVDELAKLLA